MSNALEQASLIMVPSGYENGTLGSLKPLDGSGDFTFSRGSDISATRVNEDGYIEKGYENLLLQSNTFSDAAWSSSNFTLTPNQSGYDGSTDAWKAQVSTTYNSLSQNFSGSGVYTFSGYFRKGDSNEGIRFNFSASTDTNVYVDLTDGSSTFNGTLIEKSITDVGNGFYKVVVTANLTNPNSVRIFVTNGGTTIIAGNIYIQDAMLNQGLVAYPYVETTTAPVAGGILEDMPRLDYSGLCPALLLEPQRTNLAPHSEYLDALTQDGNGDITSNSILSPEGLLNASKIEGQGGSAFIRARQVVSLPAAGSYCFSIFAKAGTSSNFTIIAANYTATGNTAADFVLTGGGSTTSNDATIEPVGNGWYRCCVYPIMDGIDLNGNFYVYVADDTGGIFFPSNADTLGQNLYLYGMQVEQDATYPTSYIPTYGTSQTRLIDDVNTLTGVGVTGDEFTIFLEFDLSDAPLVQNLGTYFQTFDSSNNSQQEFRFFDWYGEQVLSPYFRQDFTYPFGTGGDSLRFDGKILFRADGGGSYTMFFGFNGGSTKEVRTGLTAYTLNKIDFISRPKTNVKQLLIFNEALSDDECIALTTIS